MVASHYLCKIGKILYHVSSYFPAYSGLTCELLNAALYLKTEKDTGYTCLLFFFFNYLKCKKN